eukprot:scaffold2329_cov247-Pinguiococcus_pyrenoidosus.AAC.1
MPREMITTGNAELPPFLRTATAVKILRVRDHHGNSGVYGLEDPHGASEEELPPKASEKRDGELRHGSNGCGHAVLRVRVHPNEGERPHGQAVQDQHQQAVAARVAVLQPHKGRDDRCRGEDPPETRVLRTPWPPEQLAIAPESAKATLLHRELAPNGSVGHVLEDFFSFCRFRLIGFRLRDAAKAFWAPSSPQLPNTAKARHTRRKLTRAMLRSSEMAAATCLRTGEH